MYLDYAELQAARGKAMTMKDWAEKLINLTQGIEVYLRFLSQ
ncbi:virulence RhuM family protein [Patescibacteria group bacterium]|nr:virulence RhuM family protein [Patescibacteria group bacterium]